MKKLNTVYLVLISCTALIASCSKENSPVVQKTDLEKVAYTTLQEKMSSNNFNDLDWNKVEITQLKGKPVVLMIHSKKPSGKFLIFGVLNGKQSYNWVELKSASSSAKGKFSGEILLTAVNDSILNNFIVVDGKVTGTAQKGTQVQTTSASPIIKKLYVVDPGCTLPNVQVTGYLPSGSPMNFWSLYWLLNQSLDYFFSYNYDQSSVPPSGGGGAAIVEMPSLISCSGRNTVVTINADGTKTFKTDFSGSVFFNGLYAKATVSFTINQSMQSLSIPKNFSINISPSWAIGTYSLGSMDDVYSYFFQSTNTLTIYFNMNYAVGLSSLGLISTIPEQWRISINLNTPFPYTITLSK
ncbi:hypothetical protein SAMN05444410_11614 [Hydrobacter penzbergensis]|uniref:Lipoprotein n=1 Tax=Hydrobacter penzbergensis TaxID=1235997 RepID=A0A8X8LGI9_9BACT|nr:hypothetical protein [Hydrobacter penzbergensis]SDX43901.1 hypothetical protein SAMN05444410_11614 [Hydrobacter penzbergensis]